MITYMQNTLVRVLRWSERYTKTDMVYLVKAGWWLNLGVVVTSLLGLLLSIAYANLLSPATYGLYQYFLSISGLIASISLPGMNSAVAQAVARGYDGVLRKAVKAQWQWMPIPMLIGIVVALYYLARGVSTIGIGLLLIAILTPLVNIFNTYIAYFEGKRDFRGGFYLSTIITLATYGSMFLALVLVKDALALIVVNLGVSLVATMYAYYKTLHIYKPNDNVDPETITFGRHLSVLSAVGLLNQVDSVLVFHFLGSIQLAVYSFATLLPERIGGLLNFIGTAALPGFSNQSLSHIRAHIFDKIWRVALAGVAVSIAYAIAAPFVFQILFPKYITSIPYTQAFAIIIALIGITNIVNALLYAKRFTREIYVVGFLQPILLILLQIPLLIRYGIAGMLAAQLITSVITVTLTLLLFFKPLSPKYEMEETLINTL